MAETWLDKLSPGSINSWLLYPQVDGYHSCSINGITMYHHHKISQGSPAWGLPRLLWPWKAGLPETQVGDLSCWRNFRLPSTVLTCLDCQLQNQVVLSGSFTFFYYFYNILHSKFGSISILTPTSVCKRYVHNLTLRYRHMLNLDYQGSANPLRSCAERFTATAPLNRTPRQIAMTKIRRNDMNWYDCVWVPLGSHQGVQLCSTEDPSKCEKNIFGSLAQRIAPSRGWAPSVQSTSHRMVHHVSLVHEMPNDAEKELYHSLSMLVYVTAKQNCWSALQATT